MKGGWVNLPGEKVKCCEVLPVNLSEVSVLPKTQGPHVSYFKTPR